MFNSISRTRVPSRILCTIRAIHLSGVVRETVQHFAHFPEAILCALEIAALVVVFFDLRGGESKLIGDVLYRLVNNVQCANYAFNFLRAAVEDTVREREDLSVPLM